MRKCLLRLIFCMLCALVFVPLLQSSANEVVYAADPPPTLLKAVDTSVIAKGKVKSIHYVETDAELPAATEVGNFCVTDDGINRAHYYTNAENYDVYVVIPKGTKLPKSCAHFFDMEAAYREVVPLEEITGLALLDTSDVEDMSYMFASYNMLKELSFGDGWDVSKVSTMASMFAGCSLVKTLDLSPWKISGAGATVDLTEMFFRCFSLEEIDFGDWRPECVSSMRDTFGACIKLRSLNLDDWEFVDGVDLGGIFSGAYSLEELSLRNWKLKGVDLDGFLGGGTALMSVRGDVDIPTQITSPLKKVDLTGFESIDTVSVTFLCYLCNQLEEIDVSGIHTDKVEEMYCAFYGCESLKTLDLSSWETDNVTDVMCMFTWCKSLTELDVSTWNTQKVEYFGDIDDGGEDYGFLEGCKSLTELDLSNFDTSNAVDLSYMFHGCEGLKSLDISSFELSDTAVVDSMFADCDALEEIIVPATIASGVSTALPVADNWYFCNADGTLVDTASSALDDMTETTAQDGTGGLEKIAKCYTVTWKDQNGSTALDTVKLAVGSTPVYNGTAPAKVSDADYDYTFANWATSADQESGTAVGSLPAVSGDVIYYAAFSKKLTWVLAASGFRVGTGNNTTEPLGAVSGKNVLDLSGATLSRKNGTAIPLLDGGALASGVSVSGLSDLNTAKTNKDYGDSYDLEITYTNSGKTISKTIQATLDSVRYKFDFDWNDAVDSNDLNVMVSLASNVRVPSDATCKVAWMCVLDADGSEEIDSNDLNAAVLVSTCQTVKSYVQIPKDNLKYFT